MKSPLANKRRSVEVCVKCRKCGLPWNRKLQRKRHRQRNKQSSPVIHYQLSVIVIQTTVRRYLIKRHQKNNDPIELWNRKCVHYLSAKGPFAAKSHFDPYQRLAVYTSAATAIQNAWHLHRWLTHLRLLSSVTKEMNAIIIQRSWRSSWCRRSFSIVYNALKFRERVFYSTIVVGSAADATLRFCLSGCPFVIKYKQHGSNDVWVQVDCERFRSYIQQQLQLERKRRRRNSNRRRTTNLTPTKSATEIKRDKIRRMSQKKWKWFYDKKDCCEDSAQPSSKVTVDTQSSDDDDVITWLTNLDLDSCVDS